MIRVVASDLVSQFSSAPELLLLQVVVDDEECGLLL